MEEARITREALRYVVEYRNGGLRILVKLGEMIVDKAEELGITRDIALLREIGVDILISHAVPSLNLGQWVSLEGIKVLLEETTNIPFLNRGLQYNQAPVVFCPEQESVSHDVRIAELTVSVRADKLLYVTHQDGLFDELQQLIRQMTIEEAQMLLGMPRAVTGGMRTKLKAAILACQSGISRVHIISGLREGALLRELFSCEGIGTMVYARVPYQEIRKAKPAELVEIIALLREGGFPETIISSDIAPKVDSFLVLAVDEEIHGCVMVTLENRTTAEVAYLTTSKPYKHSDVPQRLLEEAIRCGREEGAERIMLDVEKNPVYLGIYPWFTGLNFQKQTQGPRKLWVKELAIS